MSVDQSCAPSFWFRRTFFDVTVAAIVAGMLTVATAGCGRGDAATSPAQAANSTATNSTIAAAATPAASPTAESRTANQVLKDMQSAYQKATTYADNGEVRLRFDRNGEPLEHVLPFSVAFERPNKLRLVCYDATIVSDGKNMRAFISTIPNVLMEVPAPLVLKVDDVTRDPQLHAALVSGPGGPPVQLPFLMTEDTLGQLLKDVMQPPKLLAPQMIDDLPCNGVEIDGPEGRLVLWIDQQQNVLRRIELPTREFQKLLEQEGATSNVSLTIDLKNAQLNQPIAATAFEVEVPAGTQVTDALVQELKPAPAAARSDPSIHKLTRLWTAADLKEPGNILVVEKSDGTPAILAFDGWRTVAELDPDGKVVARHELDIPQEAAASYLRTAVDRDGKRYFVASANGQPQFHVFDENWKLLLSYPKAEDRAADGVGDVQIVDFDGDGTLDLGVGYWGDVGVQRVSLAGERLWRDPSLQFVLRLASTEPDASGHRRLLCTHSRGSIVPITPDGKPEKEITIPNRHLHTIVGADLEGDGRQDYCGLAGSVNDENVAVGLTLDGQELWNYALASGVHGRPIEMIGTGDVYGDGAREWVLAAPDGSIHILSREGKLIDKFNHGATLAGVAPAKLGDKRVLLISSIPEKPEGDIKGVLEAWAIEPIDSQPVDTAAADKQPAETAAADTNSAEK